MAIVINAQSLDEITENRDVTKRLKRQTVTAGDIFKKEVWVYCKKLGNCVHAPVSLNDYKRIVPFAVNKPLVDEVFAMLQTYEMPNSSPSVDVDVIGYFYSIALISVAREKRTEHLAFLKQLADKFKKEDSRYVEVLYRNMKRLCKEYPDLKPIKLLLENKAV
ncbi:hypothetical protein QA584_09550 [Anaerocolumna sp. AGMB13025]|uniref:hypothetical protein n=1 Tax=Anaerocolumna sp. AGMB13025 TaxID=3039116 RepID=UPI00241FFFDE|nr:hypothetical protein [Anaerocolumna sp. AGMB13025]WFR59311.1 hypothetical protein QA584_09550 [Anaerocolumna sp. AGMB13025]